MDQFNLKAKADSEGYHDSLALGSVRTTLLDVGLTL